MTSEAPTITLDLLIGMLKEVISERTPDNQAEIEAAAWGRDTSLEDAGFSSYDFVEVIFKLEDRFGIDLDYNANSNVNNAKTIGEIYDAIAKLMTGK